MYIHWFFEVPHQFIDLEDCISLVVFVTFPARCTVQDTAIPGHKRVTFILTV